MKKPMTDDERREWIDERIVEAIERAATRGDRDTVRRLRRDRLENALWGFYYDENYDGGTRRTRHCPNCGAFFPGRQYESEEA